MLEQEEQKDHWLPVCDVRRMLRKATGGFLYWMELAEVGEQGLEEENWPKFSLKSATLVFGYHFDMSKKRILTQDEIDRYMNNSNELSEDGLEYSDDDVDF
ncbi:hypothetical protein TNIN_228111 [Trichonephila inaurata madagascariensis]|uniref:Uncharacterized protein n=1 Tax=Trichonephila inaurata madagascariensis TaxID=2747483 RepID=A0A8X6II57_9ARAC|nr:hypothetical protein TNIN_228111 [Trichonephila inaurata madagascariensis]